MIELHFPGTIISDDIFGEEGDDIFNLGVGKADLVSGGEGNDIFNVSAGSLDIRHVNGNSGRDSIVIGLSGAVSGVTIFDGGNDGDFIELSGISESGGLSGLITGGGDDDTINIFGAYGGYIEGNGGNDTIIVDSDIARVGPQPSDSHHINGKLSIEGGAGRDTIIVGSGVVGSVSGGDNRESYLPGDDDIIIVRDSGLIESIQDDFGNDTIRIQRPVDSSVNYGARDIIVSGRGKDNHDTITILKDALDLDNLSISNHIKLANSALAGGDKVDEDGFHNVVTIGKGTAGHVTSVMAGNDHILMDHVNLEGSTDLGDGDDHITFKGTYYALSEEFSDAALETIYEEQAKFRGHRPLYYTPEGLETINREIAKKDKNGNPIYVRAVTTDPNEALILYHATDGEETTNRQYAKIGPDGRPVLVYDHGVAKFADTDEVLYQARSGFGTADVSLASKDDSGDFLYIATDGNGRKYETTDRARADIDPGNNPLYVAFATYNKDEAEYVRTGDGDIVFAYIDDDGGMTTDVDKARTRKVPVYVARVTTDASKASSLKVDGSTVYKARDGVTTSSISFARLHSDGTPVEAGEHTSANPLYVADRTTDIGEALTSTSIPVEVPSFDSFVIARRSTYNIDGIAGGDIALGFGDDKTRLDGSVVQSIDAGSGTDRIRLIGGAIGKIVNDSIDTGARIALGDDITAVQISEDVNGDPVYRAQDGVTTTERPDARLDDQGYVIYLAADNKEAYNRDFARYDAQGSILYVAEDGSGTTTDESLAKRGKDGHLIYAARYTTVVADAAKDNDDNLIYIAARTTTIGDAYISDLDIVEILGKNRGGRFDGWDLKTLDSESDGMVLGRAIISGDGNNEHVILSAIPDVESEYLPIFKSIGWLHFEDGSNLYVRPSIYDSNRESYSFNFSPNHDGIFILNKNSRLFDVRNLFIDSGSKISIRAPETTGDRSGSGILDNNGVEFDRLATTFSVKGDRFSGSVILHGSSGDLDNNLSYLGGGNLDAYDVLPDDRFELGAGVDFISDGRLIIDIVKNLDRDDIDAGKSQADFLHIGGDVHLSVLRMI